ncbi:MAG TPA: PIG-L family deacetylase [Candidatus Dojkabacteria bacterium]|nr:PIG-L family deacetylase [Candidatus Dojkabacteria bacterium]
MDKYVIFLIVLVSLIVLTFLLLETLVFFIVNDLSIPTITLSKDIKRVLVIYPHPDDEILITGGFMKKHSKDREITWVVLSKGERGTPNAVLNENLKEIRADEAKRVSELLKVKSFSHYDFKDNEMETQEEKLEKKVQQIVKDSNPDLIITYDTAGLYGHPDHIITSEIVTKIAEEKNIKLWYATNAKRVLDMASLPEHMAKDPNFKDKRKYPNVKVFVGLEGSIAKSKGISIYESQLQSFVSAYPIKWIPLPIYNLPMVYEYFYQVNE